MSATDSGTQLKAGDALSQLPWRGMPANAPTLPLLAHFGQQAVASALGCCPSLLTACLFTAALEPPTRPVG